jgi:hypothetical protein
MTQALNDNTILILIRNPFISTIERLAGLAVSVVPSH